MTNGEGRCRRCGEPLNSASAIERVGFRCGLCGYVTATARRTEVELPLGHFVGWAPKAAPFLADEPDPERARAALARIARTTLTQVARRVDNEPAAALCWLQQLLAEADGISRRERERASRAASHPYRIAQMAYALLLRHGPPDFGLLQSAEPSAWFRDEAFAVLGDVSAILNVETLARRGLYRLSIVDHRVVADRTPEDLDLFELGNAIPFEKTHNRLAVLDSTITEAQRTLFGVAIDDLLALINPQRPDSGFVGLDQGNLVYVDKARSKPRARSVVEAFTLTENRLRSFAAPYFFDLGPRATPSGPVEAAMDYVELAARAGAAIWLAYYPFLDCLADRRPPTPTGVSTGPLIAEAITTAVASEAHLLYQLQKTANAKGDKIREHVARLVAGAHNAFEEAVGARFRALGVQVETGLDHLDDRPLPCGEIDVLAVVARPGAVPLALVCEAKNVDLAIYKDFGYDHLAETLKRAQVQIARKSAWVHEAWPALAQRFGAATDPAALVIGLIVTRRPVPIGLLSGWPGAVPGEIEAIVRHLQESPPEGWRSDLARGVVGAGRTAGAAPWTG